MFVGFLLLFYVVVFWIWFIVIIILILILNLIVMFFNLIGLVCRGNSDNFNLCILVGFKFGIEVMVIMDWVWNIIVWDDSKDLIDVFLKFKN